MKKMIAILCALFVLGINHTANAEPMSAGRLYQLCLAKQSEQHNKCLGYIRGLVDYHNLTRSLGTAPTVDFCVPDQLTDEEIAVFILQYLEQNNQHQSFISAPAVALALFEKYPCK